MSKRDTMLRLALASDYADWWALAQRCRMLQVRHVIVARSPDGAVIEGAWICEDAPRVCEEYMWRMNEAIERLGYTAIWRIRGSHVEFKAYLRVEEMLPVRGR